MRYRAGAIAFGAIIFCAAALNATFAQTRVADENEETRASRVEAQRAEAMTRPRRNPPPIGQPARRVISDEVNWSDVRERVRATSARDSAARQTTAAVIAAGPGLRSAAPERLPRVRAAELIRTSVPVLIPSAPGVAESVQVFGQENAYSAIAQITDGPAVRISGSRNKVVVGDQRAARTRIDAMQKRRAQLPGLDTQYLISRSDSSTDISFSKFGCGYVLSLICDDPENDARCAEDDYIVELASNLVILNANAGDAQ